MGQELPEPSIFVFFYQKKKFYLKFANFEFRFYRLSNRKKLSRFLIDRDRNTAMFILEWDE